MHTERKCMAKLNKKEIKIVREVEKGLLDNQGIIDGACFANAQRMTMTGSGLGYDLLYHEGFVHRPKGRMKHAWNTLNGKIVDVSARNCPIEHIHIVADKYKATNTYTSIEVCMHSIKTGGLYWIHKG